MRRRHRARSIVACVSGSAALVLFASQIPALADDVTLVDHRSFLTNAAWAPDGRLFFNEKDSGEVWVYDRASGRVSSEPLMTVPVHPGGEQGLLGIALDPDFDEEPWVYLSYSDEQVGRNRVVRMRTDDMQAGVEPVIELLPIGPGYHNGGDIAFGPDGKLYVTVGEIHEAARAQDPSDLGGKILRLEPDGSIPSDGQPKSFEGSAVYSMGHRNSFGICFDRENGQLWETENGPESYDEINRIQGGGNYGWPVRSGPQAGPDPSLIAPGPLLDPEASFEEIIAPTGCVADGGMVWFGDLRGRLYRLDPPGEPRVVREMPSGIVDLQWAPDGGLTVVMTDSITIVDIGKDPDERGPAASRPQRPVRSAGIPRWAVLVVVGVAAVAALAYRRRRHSTG